MNGYGVQDLGVALVAALALGWLVWRSVRRRRGATSAACPNCPVANPVPGTRPAPMPRVRPTAEGEAALRAKQRPVLITITERRPGTGSRP